MAAHRAGGDDATAMNGLADGVCDALCGAAGRTSTPPAGCWLSLGQALGVAILVHDVEGDGPVILRGTVLHGSDGVDVTVQAASEAEALVELAAGRCGSAARTMGGSAATASGWAAGGP